MSAWYRQWLAIFTWIGRAIWRLILIAVVAVPIFGFVHVMWIFVGIPLAVITLGRIGWFADVLAYALGFSLFVMMYGLPRAFREVGSWREFRWGHLEDGDAS